MLHSIPLAMLLQGISASATGDTFSPFVFASMTHDSNLLRLSSTAGGADPSDTIRQAGAGLDVDWHLSRQQVVLTAAVNENRFDRHSTLNYTGHDVKGAWNWQFADHFSGDVGYTNNLAIGSFAYQQALVSNLRVQERRFFDGLWSFHPSWQVGGGVSKNNLSFLDPAQRVLNRQEDVSEAVAQYVSSANNKGGIRLRETNGAYPNQPLDFVNLLDTGYRQREVIGFVDWKDDGHNVFQGYAGTVHRWHDHFSRRDYSDVNARGTYGWLATGHTRVNLSAWREIWAYDDLSTSYSRNRGAAIEPRWMPYATTTLSVTFQREQRDFLGDPGIILFAMARQDTVIRRELALTYEPAPGYSFKASVSDDRRESNQAIFGYSSKMASVSAVLHL